MSAFTTAGLYKHLPPLFFRSSNLPTRALPPRAAALLEHGGGRKYGRHEGGVLAGGRRGGVRVLQLGGDDLGAVALVEGI